MNTKVILILLSTAACGSVVEEAAVATAQAVEQAKSSLDDTIDAASMWVEQPQLEQREHECRKENGEWVELVQVAACKDGYAEIRMGDEVQQQPCKDGTGLDYEFQCVHRNADGWVYFNDGPSHPPWVQRATDMMDVNWDVGRWNNLFWHAGVNHDYCYHHNDVTQGLSQKQCDEQFLSDLSAVCCEESFKRISWFDQDLCRKHAAAMYSAVRAVGHSSYDVMNTQIDYPAWKPLWQVFGMDQPVTDTELMQQVDDFLRE